MRLKRKRHPVNLLEIMIVILLIGVIGGVLSYNLKGTLDRGKTFRTEEGAKRLADILNIQVELGVTKIEELFGTNKIISSADAAVKTCVQKSQFIPASELEAFLQDGWKKPYNISLETGDVITVKSAPVTTSAASATTPAASVEK